MTFQMVVYLDLVFLCQVCILDSEVVAFMKVTILKPLQFLHFFPSFFHCVICRLKFAFVYVAVNFWFQLIL